jgi:glycosyltransferase involved in cell wall biosynthesis
MLWPDDERANAIRRAYEGARKVYFVSQGNLRLVENMLGTAIGNAKVVRNPFNVSYTAECPYPSAEPTFNVACVSRLEPYAKGQDLLFEVLRLDKWKRRNLKVSLFGDGGNVESLKALARRYDLGNVHFEGYAQNIQRVWDTHHLLVVPSRIEGLPLALVEAMLCGRTSVVTNVAGNVEVVDDGVTGFVAASPTPAHIDEAMERAWERRDSWEEMGREAGRRIRQLVPPDPAGVFADELLRLI